MGTLAGDKPVWGEDWGYDRARRHYSSDIADIVPSSSKEVGDRDEAMGPPDDLSGLLVCTVFWVLLIAEAVLWWAGK